MIGAFVEKNSAIIEEFHVASAFAGAVSDVFCDDFDFSFFFCENMENAVLFTEIFFENDEAFELKGAHGGEFLVLSS